MNKKKRTKREKYGPTFLPKLFYADPKDYEKFKKICEAEGSDTSMSEQLRNFIRHFIGGFRLPKEYRV